MTIVSFECPSNAASVARADALLIKCNPNKGRPTPFVATLGISCFDARPKAFEQNLKDEKERVMNESDKIAQELRRLDRWQYTQKRCQG